MTDGQQTAIIIVSLACSTALLIPVVRGVVQRIAPRPGAGPGDDEIAQLHERIAELDGVAVRVQELEERVDFAERLLANRPESVELPQHRTPV